MEALKITITVQNENTGKETVQEARILSKVGSTFVERGERLLEQAIIESLAPENYEAAR